MFGRNRRAKTTVAETAGTVTGAVTDAADAVVGYVDPLAKDEKLRQRLVAAVLAGAAARQRIRRQTGLPGLARRLAADPVLRAQLIELGTQLQAAQKRAKKASSHKLRNTVLFVHDARIQAERSLVVRRIATLAGLVASALLVNFILLGTAGLAASASVLLAAVGVAAAVASVAVVLRLLRP